MTFILALIVLGSVLPLAVPPAEAASIAIDKQRAQLLKDAIAWMTFRKQGQLMSDQDLAPLFLNVLEDKYVKSKFYRTFVIAFQLGVLPRLTLQENHACDPAYTKEYRDPRNNSVTWHYQKKFTFDLYSKRDSSALQFCDYRQGLVCNKHTKTCQCPEGATMSPIDQGSSVKRCLLKQDEICALIDIDHGNDPKHKLLANHIYQLAFNLEKPPSCQLGTQCRFKDNAKDYPRCYDVASGPFYTDDSPHSMGEDCAIGLYAEPGSCNLYGGTGYFRELTCYDFGPPRSSPSASGTGRKGFCASAHFGPYGISDSGSVIDGQFIFHPLFIPYVHPRTVPLRYELGAYYAKFISHVLHYMDIQGAGNFFIMVNYAGERCSVARTEQFEKAWQYYASLEDPPAPGSDYAVGATTAELDAKLQELSDFVKNPDLKVCKIFFNFYRFAPGDFSEEMESLKCVKDGTTDADGNDGTCQSPGNLDTMQFAKKLQDVLDEISLITIELQNEERNYKDEILRDNPEPPCSLELAPLPVARSTVVDALEGGACPDGSVCYEDFSDVRGIYDGECELKTDAKQRFVCHDTSQPMDKCEGEYLKKKVERVLEHLDKFAKLKKGQKCYPEFEQVLRENDASGLDKLSQYQILGWLNKGLLCDKQGGNLECTVKGTCDCIEGKCIDNTVTTVDRSSTEYEEGNSGVGVLKIYVSSLAVVVGLVASIMIVC